MPEQRKRIADYIDQHKDELIREVQNAVRIKSLVGEEQEMQAFMKKKFEEIGLKVVESQPSYEQVSKHEAYCHSGFPFEGRTNIVGIYEGSDAYKSLTLEGHVDVVSAEPEEVWSYDPWGAEIVGNRMYGRGALDMKSGLMANWFAMKALLELGLKPKGSVQLHSTIEEESGGGAGALALMEEGFLTDGYLTTEPHALRVTVSHSGVMYFRVKVVGKTAHAARSQEGINAIGKMYKIYHALEELDRKRGEEVIFELIHKASDGRSCNLNLGRMEAGDWVSSVAGWAVLECRLGFIPGESREDMKRLIDETIADAIKGDEWLEQYPPEVEWFGWTTEAWYQDPDHPYVQEFIKSAKETLGRDEIEIIGRTGGNDARFTQYYNRPGIGFGPDGKYSHGPDEYVEIDTIIDTAKVLANHILDWTSIPKA
ncbi:ArgE/DapE family deacylase [Ornithinibacillus sp. 4-3]|uniref:ArgE/DapE family deacylase n=1 Tax=Ornithinibacillus sp. 4-3 TaxID=3231488 RepID=A0AB39HRG7_9BACI